MKNELLTIGPLTVYGYGAMIALGVIAAWVVTELRAKKLRLSSDHVFALVLWGLLGGLLCAKLLYWITEWKSIIADPGFGHTIGRICGLWRDPWRNPCRLDLLQEQKSRFLEIF